MKCTIINESDAKVPRLFLESWLDALVAVTSKYVAKKRYVNKELTLVFLKPVRARKLNRTYRGKDYATDVLSFASQEPESLGDLVFCPKVLERQAKENGWSQRLELGYMIVHGFLHLLGYDHERSAKEATKMFRLQEAIFEQVRLSATQQPGKPKR